MSIDPNNLAATAHVTFNDDFNTLSLWNGSAGTWSTTFWYQAPDSNGATLAGNGEQEWYINSQYGGTRGITPWTAANGTLTLTATPTPAGAASQVNYAPYVSGEVNTVHSFSQTYGYFEMRAELPKGQGFWPAFWLMPTDGSWPPELDAMEVLGSNTSALVTTVHSAATGAHTMASQYTTIPDASAGFHTYGVDWEPDHITWYFDGQKVFQTATPADMNKPMYMIANLAVGGYWPGNADGTSSAQMQIDYIRAYASGAGNTPNPSPSAPSPSASHVANGQLVYELYQAAYGRAPDAGGFSYWTGAADAGVPVKALADSFIAAPEFTQIYGSNPSNETYVAELYGHVLGRAPDAGGQAFWVSQADAGMTRDSLMVAFATSPENVQLIGSHASDLLAAL